MGTMVSSNSLINYNKIWGHLYIWFTLEAGGQLTLEHIYVPYKIQGHSFWLILFINNAMWTRDMH